MANKVLFSSFQAQKLWQERGEGLLAFLPFTTLKMVQEQWLFVEDHLKRLECAMKILYGRVDRECLHQLKEKLEQIKSDQVLRVALLPLKNKVEFIITFRPKNLSTLSKKLCVTGRENFCHAPSLLKAGNYRQELQAREAVSRLGFNDFIRVEREGEIAEASTSNIFFFDGEHFMTPRLRPGILAGITRHHLIVALHEQGHQVIEKTLNTDHLIRMEGMWLCNAIRDIEAVESWDEWRFENSFPLQKIYQEYVQRWLQKKSQ